MDVFDDPDIAVITNDRDANWAVWEVANAAEQNGDKSYEIAEKMQKALTPERIHEIWIVLNDALTSAGLLFGVYKAWKALGAKAGRRITVKLGARVKLSRDDRDRLESIGVALAFEKQDGTNAWDEGRLAFNEGKALEECPHTESNDREAWTNGWRDAESASRRF